MGVARTTETVVPRRTSGVDKALRKSANEAFVQPLVRDGHPKFEKSPLFLGSKCFQSLGFGGGGKGLLHRPCQPLPSLTTLVKWSITKKLPTHEVVQSEVSELLAKGAVEVVSPKTPGFYTTLFVIPKKGAGTYVPF